MLGEGPFPVASEFPKRPYAKVHHQYDPTAKEDLKLAVGDVVGILVQSADGNDIIVLYCACITYFKVGGLERIKENTEGFLVLM